MPFRQTRPFRNQAQMDSMDPKRRDDLFLDHNLEKVCTRHHSETDSLLLPSYWPPLSCLSIDSNHLQEDNSYNSKFPRRLPQHLASGARKKLQSFVSLSGGQPSATMESNQTPARKPIVAVPHSSAARLEVGFGIFHSTLLQLGEMIAQSVPQP